jgi:hypothetical protein
MAGVAAERRDAPEWRVPDLVTRSFDGDMPLSDAEILAVRRFARSPEPQRQPDDGWSQMMERFIIPIMGDALGEVRKKLRDEIGQLRAEMNVLTSIARGQITELKTKGKPDAAA